MNPSKQSYPILDINSIEMIKNRTIENPELVKKVVDKYPSLVNLQRHLKKFLNENKVISFRFRILKRRIKNLIVQISSLEFQRQKV